MYKDDEKKFKVKDLVLLEEELKLLGELSDRKGREWPLRVFIADGDAMALPVGRLREILLLIRKHLPGVRRVSSYCLPRNLNSKTAEQLKGATPAPAVAGMPLARGAERGARGAQSCGSSGSTRSTWCAPRWTLLLTGHVASPTPY